MYYKSHKFQYTRKRIKEELTRLGWKEHECPYELSDKKDLYQRHNSPHIDDSFFWYENCLKRINTGEAYYALEYYAHVLPHLSWRCNTENPNNKNVLDTFDAWDIAHDIMLDGVNFDYSESEDEPRDESEDPSTYRGHIQIIDWDHPKRNTYEYVMRWPGAKNDGFAWDVVLLINAIPVAAILLEADGEGESACQHALDVAHAQLDVDYQFPVYCHYLIVSNGTNYRYGYPWVELDQYAEINSISEKLTPVDFLQRLRGLE